MAKPSPNKKSLMVSSDDDDQSLMAAIQNGSHQAFSFLVRRHSQRFFKTAHRICGDFQVSEDLVQDAFLKIWQNPNIWQHGKGAKFTTWFYRVLMNQNIDRLRKEKKNITIDDEYVDDQKSPEAQMAMTQEQVLIEKAISSLPIRQKMAITLSFYEGLSNMDAAYAMDVNIKAFESLVMRGKAGIREFLDKNHKGLMEKEVKYAAQS